MSESAATSDIRDCRARSPRWKKALFGTFTAVGFFVLFEATLALLAIQPVAATRDPFVGFAALPLFVEAKDSTDGPQMETAQNKLAYFNRQSFPPHKADGTFRIFCLGGSTTYGHPYYDTTSFAGWLRELLPMARCETRWEVINAGGISYASYRVAALMEELSAYEPDLFIVYTGHNEFLEERTYGELKDASPARIRITSALAYTRTYALLDSLLHSPLPQPVDQLASEVDALLDHSVGPTDYHRDDKLRQQVLEHFEFNLYRMADIARSAEAELLLITPACNLKDCSPFKSEHAPRISEEPRQQVAALLAQVRQLAQQGEFAQALAACEAAKVMDDRFAEVHFLEGQQLWMLDRRAEAVAAFRRAADEDICPVRAVSEIPAAVRRVALQLDLPLVDYVQLLENDSLRHFGHNALGNEYFLDHVHPTIDATGLLAVEIARELARRNVIESGATWSEADVALATTAIESRVDENVHAVALRTLAKVLNWAGKHEQAGPLALQVLDTLPDDPEALVLAAAYLKSTGQTDQAIDNYRRALQSAPQYIEAHRLLGAALVERGDLEEALAHIKRLTTLTPEDAHAWHMCGAVLAELGRFEEALQPYATALQLDSDNPHLLYNLGYAYEQLGKTSQARTYFRRTLELNPDDAGALRELRTLDGQ